MYSRLGGEGCPACLEDLAIRSPHQLLYQLSNQLLNQEQPKRPQPQRQPQYRQYPPGKLDNQLGQTMQCCWDAVSEIGRREKVAEKEERR